MLFDHCFRILTISHSGICTSNFRLRSFPHQCQSNSRKNIRSCQHDIHAWTSQTCWYTVSLPLLSISRDNMSSSWLLSLYPILLTRIYLDMVASIYNRKPIQHHLEARVWVPVNGEARDEEEVHIRFTYNSQSMPNEDPDPITFATPMSTMTHSNSEPEVELENVLPRRTSSRRNATWRRHSGLFVL